MTAIRPLRDLLYVERIKRDKTDGGILIPATFDHKHRPSLKHGSTPDYFEAKVLAIGPDVREPEVTVGTRVLVHTYADGDGSKLYTGESVGDRDHLFVRCPDDLVCLVDLEEHGLQVAP